jgi:hypothetical protein
VVIIYSVPKSKIILAIPNIQKGSIQNIAKSVLSKRFKTAKHHLATLMAESIAGHHLTPGGDIGGITRNKGAAPLCFQLGFGKLHTQAPFKRVVSNFMKKFLKRFVVISLVKDTVSLIEMLWQKVRYHQIANLLFC